MGCNCRGSTSYIPTINRAGRASSETLCQQLARAQMSLSVKVTDAGGIILPTATMPAHSTLSVHGCRGSYTEKILGLELSLTVLFGNADTRREFLKRLGANPTLGSIDALLKVYS